MTVSLEMSAPAPATRASTRLAVRCHWCTPAPVGELSDWLDERLDELRAEDPELLVRHTRLTQHLPGTTVDDGWLIELERPPDSDGASALLESLEDLMGEMRILGLSPTLLIPEMTVAAA